MKKVLTLLLISTMLVGLVTGCSKSSETTDKTTNDATTPAATEAPAATDNTNAADTTDTATAEAAKTGFAVITSIGSSKDASAEADGTAQVDSLLVAVLVDGAGKILDCQIDQAQTKINFSAEGKLTTDIATIFKSKQELGTEYGMLKASGIGKEWNEQADAFANYVIGKTVDEVKGIAVTEDGKASDADLAASVSVHITDFIAGVEKAVANAQDLGAKVGDQIGLAVTTEISKSSDASADADGLAQAYSNYAVVTVGADGKITSCIIDASQGNVNFSATGTITSDLAAETQTKQELKENYGMKKASGLGKEWYEQGNAFATYVTGKTVDEVKSIAVTEDGHAGDADLAASVSVHVTPFIANVEKAVANAAK